MPAPLLVLEDARIDVDGVPSVDGLTLTSRGERVLVLGAARALFEATVGLRRVMRGRVAVSGASPVDAVRERLVAGAPFDPPLPPTLSPLEYATWSARLVGRSRSEAKAAAHEAIDRLALGAFAQAPIAGLVTHARRATVVAAAMATGARLLVLEDPLGGLPEEAAQAWATMLVAALGGAPVLVFSPRVAITSPLALAADEAIVVSGARVDAAGSPSDLARAERRISLRVEGSVAALAARLAERGVTLEEDGARVLVDLGAALTTSELLGLCGEASVTVVELYPVARALA